MRVGFRIVAIRWHYTICNTAETDVIWDRYKDLGRFTSAIILIWKRLRKDFSVFGPTSACQYCDTGVLIERLYRFVCPSEQSVAL